MSRSSESEQAYEYCYDSNWMWTTDERILIQSKTSHDLQNGEKQEDSSNPLDLDSLRQTDHKSTTASENPENAIDLQSNRFLESKSKDSKYTLLTSEIMEENLVSPDNLKNLKHSSDSVQLENPPIIESSKYLSKLKIIEDRQNMIAPRILKISDKLQFFAYSDRKKFVLSKSPRILSNSDNIMHLTPPDDSNKTSEETLNFEETGESNIEGEKSENFQRDPVSLGNKLCSIYDAFANRFQVPSNRFAYSRKSVNSECLSVSRHLLRSKDVKYSEQCANFKNSTELQHSANSEHSGNLEHSENLSNSENSADSKHSANSEHSTDSEHSASLEHSKDSDHLSNLENVTDSQHLSSSEHATGFEYSTNPKDPVHSECLTSSIRSESPGPSRKSETSESHKFVSSFEKEELFGKKSRILIGSIDPMLSISSDDSKEISNDGDSTETDEIYPFLQSSTVNMDVVEQEPESPQRFLEEKSCEALANPENESNLEQISLLEYKTEWQNRSIMDDESYLEYFMCSQFSSSLEDPEKPLDTDNLTEQAEPENQPDLEIRKYRNSKSSDLH
uniref:Uncharacterized protein n=1 Tax=Onchocerca volvulus TaxID=6282 RepID=A0A8R1U130_ONCVO